MSNDPNTNVDVEVDTTEAQTTPEEQAAADEAQKNADEQAKKDELENVRKIYKDVVWKKPTKKISEDIEAMQKAIEEAEEKNSQEEESEEDDSEKTKVKFTIDLAFKDKKYKAGDEDELTKEDLDCLIKDWYETV